MRQRLACQRSGIPQDRLAHPLKMAFDRLRVEDVHVIVVTSIVTHPKRSRVHRPLERPTTAVLRIPLAERSTTSAAAAGSRSFGHFLPVARVGDGRALMPDP